ncbi:MAG TPA: TolC family protein [Polyangia bacterium]
MCRERRQEVRSRSGRGAFCANTNGGMTARASVAHPLLDAEAMDFRSHRSALAPSHDARRSVLGKRVAELVLAAVAALTAFPASAQAKRSVSLEEAIGLAHQRRAELAMAGIDSELARADLLSAQLQRVRLTVDVGASEQRMAVSLPSESCAANAQACGITGRLSSRHGSAALTVPVWSGLRITSGVARARLLAEAAQKDQRSREQAVAHEVATTYWAVRRVELIAGVTQQGARDGEDIHEITRARAAAGLVPAVDGLRAHAHKSRQEAELALLEAQSTEARALLGSALQLRDTLVLTSDPPLGPAPLPALDSLLAQARRQRPELDAVRARLAAQEMAIRTAYGDLSPEIDLKAQIDVQRGDAHFPGSVASAGIFLNWRIFDSLNTVQDIRRAKMMQRRLSAEEERALIEVETEVRVAHARYGGALAQQASLASAQEAAAAAAIQTRRRYNSGNALLVEVLQAQSELLQIRVALIDSRISIAQSAAAITAAVGSTVSSSPR